jgi:hypothetical protein
MAASCWPAAMAVPAAQRQGGNHQAGDQLVVIMSSFIEFEDETSVTLPTLCKPRASGLFFFKFNDLHVIF